jgi:hypothetical protein
MTKAQSQTTRTDQAKSEKVKRSQKVITKLVETPTSRNTKQVNAQSESKSKAKACGKMRQKQVEKLDEASQPKPAKRQAKSKTSEVQRPRLPNDASVNEDQQKSTEP